jgi:hypothetical protein
MNHQPFEDWIFEETLSEPQQKELKRHLGLCDDCRRLHEAMKGVEWSFTNTVETGPRPGFAQRWEIFAEKKVKQEQNLAAWIILTSLVMVAASIVLVNFGEIWFQNINIFQLGVAGVVRTIDVATQTVQWVSAINFFMRAIPSGWAQTIGLTMGAVAIFWVTVWIAAIRRITANQRRIV